jgi:hypothetical protein
MYSSILTRSRITVTAVIGGSISMGTVSLIAAILRSFKARRNHTVTEAILEGLRQLEHVKAVGAVILDRIVGVIDHHTPQEMGVACSTAARTQEARPIRPLIVCLSTSAACGLPITGCVVGLHQANGDHGHGRGHKPRQQHKPDREYEPHQPIVAGARQASPAYLVSTAVL